MAKRPTFFLSSTIYDFRDLRGAIKYMLEDRGCRVLASEFNDFDGNLDQHSYEACLGNIDQADHFILLVGGRVGGWYDEPNRVSITQQEYRHAYERHKAGALKIVTLVRDEVWQLREDRKALARHLAKLDMTDKERKQVASFQSRFATDAEFVGAFLTEIGRNRETAAAVREGTDKPTGNWIYQFRDFRDVADVLHPLTFGGLTADEAAYRKALQHELIGILKRLLLKYEGEALDPRYAVIKHWEKYGLRESPKEGAWVRLPGHDWGQFSTIMFALLGLSPFELVVVADALTSSLFLKYDGSTGGYEQTDAYRALAKLVEEIRLFNSRLTVETLTPLIECSPRSRGGADVPVEISAHKLATLHGLALRWVNIVSLSRSLIVHLHGQEFTMPGLMPFSPVHGLEAKLDIELPNEDDVRRWVGIL